MATSSLTPAGVRSEAQPRATWLGPGPDVAPAERVRVVVLAVALATATVAVHGSGVGNGFSNFDDDMYVTDNVRVLRGLSWDGLWDALTTFHAANWHPLTWLSLRLDATLYRTVPWGFHLTSVLLHAAAASLVFAALWAMTRRTWAALLAAGLFALHPLRVESVAWVAERKDVLSGLFFALGLWAYARYARGPGVGRYAAVAGALALGLAAKQSLVTVPLVLLLLDAWPLGRFGPTPGGARIGRLVAEKVPLLLLAAGASVLTVLAQRAWGAVGSIGQYPLGIRLSNACVSLIRYLAKTVWPEPLSPFYTHPGASLPTWAVAGAAAALIGLTAAAGLLRRRAPYLLVGWLWFLGMLVPVLGLVQVGRQAMADRYTYLPSIGLAVAAGWTLWDAGRRSRAAATAAALVSVVVSAGYATATVRQTMYWHDDLRLWGHAMAAAPDSETVQNNFGRALDDVGAAADSRAVAAAARAAAAPAPRGLGVLAALNDLAVAAAEARTAHADAAEHYRRALEVNPNDPEAHYNLGVSYARAGDPERGAEEFEKAAHLRPSFEKAWNNLGLARARSGRLPEAVAAYNSALALRPDYVLAHLNLAEALRRLGLYDEAKRHTDEAERLGGQPGVPRPR